jgi:CheY-like chemotaxis protein
MTKMFERRRSPRTQIRARALVRSRGKAMHAVLENLSAGGARLVGDLAVVPGQRLEVLLELEGEPARLDAVVVRVEDGDVDDAAIEFRDVAPGVQDRIHELVVAALERQRDATPTSILVIDATERIRIALERDLAELGREAVLATSPLEALWTLQDRSRRYDTAIIELDPRSDSRSDPHAELLLGYLIDRHPEIRRIVLSAAPELAEPQLVAGRAHAVLAKPWHPRGLRLALQPA